MTDIKGNAAKFEAYASAWERIAEAEKAGFFLEAITLEESIVTDRILSYVWSDNRTISARKATLGKVIQAAQKVAQRRQETVFVELLGRVGAWAKSRNDLLHGWVKTDPGGSPMSPAQRLQQAKEVCRDGAGLAREVSDIHRTLKREATRPKAA